MERINTEEYQRRREERMAQLDFYQAPEEEEMSGLTKSGIVAAAALGIAGVGYRTGGVAKLSRLLAVEGRAAKVAVSETMERKGFGEMRQAFRETYEREVAKQRDRNDVMNWHDQATDEAFDMQRIIRQRDQVIGKKRADGTYSGDLADQMREAERIRMLRSQFDETHEAQSLIDRMQRTNGMRLRAMDDQQLGELLGGSEGVHADVMKKWRTLQQVNIEKYNKEAAKRIEDAVEGARTNSLDAIFEMTKAKSYTNPIKGAKAATVDDVLRWHNEGRIKLDDETRLGMEEILQHNQKFKDNVFDTALLNRRNNIEDHRVLRRGMEGFMDWAETTLPGRLTKMQDFNNMRKAERKAAFRMFANDSVQPILNAHLGRDLKDEAMEPLLYMNGDFFRNGAEQINQNKMFLVSSQYGSFGKYVRHAAGLMTEEKDRGRLARWLDIGAQDRDSSFHDWVSTFTKFADDTWEPKRMAAIFGKEGKLTQEDDTFIRQFMSANTGRLSTSTVEQFAKMTGDDTFKGVSFSSQADRLRLFEEIGASLDEMSNKGVKNVNDDLLRLYRSYQRNPDEFLAQTRPVGQASPIFGGQNQMVTGMDRIDAELSGEVVRRAIKVVPEEGVDAYGTLFKNVKQWQEEGILTKDQAQEANYAISRRAIRRFRVGGAIDEETSQAARARLFNEDDEIGLVVFQSIGKQVKEQFPFWAPKSDTMPENQINDLYIAVNQMDWAKTVNPIGMYKQIAAGRNSMEDFTALSAYGGYMLPHRLQGALGSVGLGFSDDSMSSGLAIWRNLMLKRVAPIIGGYTGYEYLNEKFEDVTGESLSDRYRIQQEMDKVLEAKARDSFGTDVEDIKKRQQLRPGAEQWNEFPEFFVPFIGDVGLGKMLNSSLNPIGALVGWEDVSVDPNDARTGDEAVEDLQTGVEAVRKGRWWAFGSSTPYAGDKIIEYAPTAYRKATSDYQYTDAMYGDDDERWKNSWFPTLENPLGALGYVVGTADPYWFERMHYNDRPYLLTAPLFDPNTPFFGDIGNLTLGNLLKPQRTMHPEYFLNGQPVLNPAEGEGHEGESVTKISGGGRIEMMQLMNAADADISLQDLKAEYQRVASEQGEDDNGMPVEGEDGRGTIMRRDRKSLRQIRMQDLEARFQKRLGELKSYSSGMPIPMKDGMPAVLTSDSSYRNFSMEKKMFEDNVVENAADPRSLDFMLQEFGQNLWEPQGVYAWLIKDELLGQDPYADKAVIADASEAIAPSERFWDQNLGSMGGELSEIMRRFIRRDSAQLEQVNPVRNTMPDWMPGSDYFTDFKSGDPMAKISGGEYRLPGAGYESMNELHPDETSTKEGPFGKYGAFDRFKILADVAPYSDEYRFWKEYVEDNIKDKDTRKEVSEIKRQVARKTDKRRLFEYRFEGQELEMRNVTVKRFIDDYTFLTEELGDQPIRMAGVDVKMNSDGALGKRIEAGDSIQIGINADPSKQISNDTYGTMRAVIYKNMNNINQELIARAEVREQKTDFSATGVHARFTPSQIEKGAAWERFAHPQDEFGLNALLPNSFRTKFLNVRSALEDYELTQVYGKQWRTWEGVGVTDYLKPAMDQMIANKDPLMSTAAGAMSGLFIGRVILGGGQRTKWATAIGAAAGLGLNLYGDAYESVNERSYRPDRRLREDAVNEYFDVLKYIKNRMLFEKGKQELLEGGFDLDALLLEHGEKEKELSMRIRELQEEKKAVYIAGEEDSKEQRGVINKKMEELTAERKTLYEGLPEEVNQVLVYKNEMESTLFGADVKGDRLKLMRALPSKDKEYFEAFVNAKESDREKILELVPENQKDMYRQLWGMEPQNPKSLEQMVQKYDIPRADWLGWAPEVDLNDVKLRQVEREGLDATDFGLWGGDYNATANTPDAARDGTIGRERGLSAIEIEQQVHQLLMAEGLQGVDVVVRETATPGMHTRVRHEEDRTEEVREGVRDYIEQEV